MIQGMPAKLYSDSLSLAANARSRFSDEAQIRNPFDGGMWIDAVSFARDAVPAQAGQDQLAVVDVQFTLGRHGVTNSFVPIEVLCPPDDSRTQPFTGFNTWKLPTPLYVPKGGVLSPEFLNRAASTQTVRMLYHVRQATGPVPQKMNVPWVAMWRGIARSGATDTADQSRQSDLLNPHAAPLNVERFTGRIMDTGGALFDNEAAAIPSITRYSLLRMFSSDGKIIVRDRTPWASVFNLADMTWRAKGVLGPKEWVIAYLDELLSGVVYPSGGASNYVPVIAMVGHREEEVTL